ncbi:porin [Thorsellia kenyensis]|uniref:Porin n=1 Tax=Thorsellia kenyensis TaxID=1549888 RepID=A0ABV6C6L9_9GAMM
MINRKILSISITLASISGIANAAEIYNKEGNKIDLIGLIEADYKIRGKENPTANGEARGNHANQDGTFARLGFNAQTQINSELTGYAKFEREFGVNESSSDGTPRYAYAGLKWAEYGSIDFGRNYGVVGKIRDFSDQAAMFGGSGFGGGSDIFLTDLTSGLATYTNNNFFSMVPGFDIYLQYQVKDTNGDVLEQNGDGFAVASTYHHSPTGLGAGATYAKSDRIDAQINLNGNESADGKNAEIWAVAANYDANHIYLGLSWSESNNMLPVKGDMGVIEIANKTRGLEVVANYTFDFGLMPSVVYNQSKGYNLHGFIDSNDGHGKAVLVKYIAVGAQYDFTKEMDMAVGYKINLLDANNAYTRENYLASDDQIEMRLTYAF